ncbi:MAG: EamA family transporter [bacterium]|nr:EamA family transporter [bacterium]
MWILYAIGSAIFAALTAITAKIGVSGVNSNLATAIRTFVVLLISTGIVFSTKEFQNIPSISQKTWIFLIVSGLMTGLSWLCYFKALQMGETSRVVTIDKFSLVFVLLLSAVFLKETMNVKMIIGCILITVGTILMVV